MVKAHASHAEGLRLEPYSMPWLNARSLFTQQQMGTQWEHWEDKGGEERNWPPYLTCRWLRISVLSNRHSPTYESIRDLYAYVCTPCLYSIKNLKQYLEPTVLNCDNMASTVTHYYICNLCTVAAPRGGFILPLLLAKSIRWENARVGMKDL